MKKAELFKIGKLVIGIMYETSALLGSETPLYASNLAIYPS